MADIPRLNGIIRALEQGLHAFTAFTPADVESAIALATSKYDGVVYEMEHNPYDIRAFRDCLQYMLNRRLIAQPGSLSPSVTPMARIRADGGSALLGRDAAGILRARRRVAAQSQGRNLRHPDDRGHRGNQEPARNP